MAVTLYDATHPLIAPNGLTAIADNPSANCCCPTTCDCLDFYGDYPAGSMCVFQVQSIALTFDMGDMTSSPDIGGHVNNCKEPPPVCVTAGFTDVKCCTLLNGLTIQFPPAQAGAGTVSGVGLPFELFGRANYFTDIYNLNTQCFGGKTMEGCHCTLSPAARETRGLLFSVFYWKYVFNLPAMDVWERKPEPRWGAYIHLGCSGSAQTMYYRQETTFTRDPYGTLNNLGAFQLKKHQRIGGIWNGGPIANNNSYGDVCDGWPEYITLAATGVQGG